MITKHGTTSQITGSYVEFQAAVLRALPRDIDFDAAIEWMNNGESLARVLREALAPDGKLGNTYPLTINYERSVKDAVKFGRYDWANGNINTRNFQTKRTGKANIVVELIHFNKNISTDQALSELDRMEYLPAKLYELLAFGKKYPDIQREFPVVALGSVWQDRRGNRYVPCLDGLSLGRHLSLDLVGYDWRSFYRFAAIHK